MRKLPFVAIASVLAACGGQARNRPLAPSVAPLAPIASIATQPPARPSRADSSPVAAPTGLVATARIAHPARAMQLLAPVLGGLGTLLQGFDSTALAQLAVGAPVGGVIDLEQPIDVAVVHQSDATDLGVLIAGSAQLVDSPTTREAFESHFSLVPIAADMLRLRPREAASDG